MLRRRVRHRNNTRRYGRARIVTRAVQPCVPRCPRIKCAQSGEAGMKHFAALLFAFCVACPAYGQITKFTHIIVVVQENRTPDNLFQGLCKPPYGTAASCSTTPSATQYDILTNNWVDGASTVTPGTVPLAGPYDLGHSHGSWVSMCDLSAGACKMDGAGKIVCGPTASCPTTPQFRYVDNSTGILNPYLDLATSYGWANYMFQTNQGLSFPAHQFIFGGSSALSAADDASGFFISGNFPIGSGCY